MYRRSVCSPFTNCRMRSRLARNSTPLMPAKVLEYVQRLWGRPVHLETNADGEGVVMRFDGEDHDEE